MKEKYSTNTRATNILIGQKIYKRRKELKLRSIDLANSLGVSITQINKYEKGDNRVAASTLFLISQILYKTPINYFFEGIKDYD